MKTSSLFPKFPLGNHFTTFLYLFHYQSLVRTSLFVIWLLTGLSLFSHAQVYYSLSDGSPTSRNDQLRRINLDGNNDVLVKSNFIQTAGPVVLDAANNRLLVADIRISQPPTTTIPNTSTANTSIIAVSLAAGNPVSGTLVTPYISGSASTVIASMALDRANNYLYYMLNDGNATSNADQLRRINLDGTNDVLVKSNFVQTAGPVVLDAANNRLLVADTRPTTTTANNTKIVAVSLASGNPVTTLVTAAPISTTTTTVAGIALDRN